MYRFFSSTVLILFLWYIFNLWFLYKLSHKRKFFFVFEVLADLQKWIPWNLVMIMIIVPDGDGDNVDGVYSTVLKLNIKLTSDVYNYIINFKMLLI